jgi:site-specific recombinase XerD
MTFSDYLKTQYHYSEKSLIVKEKNIFEWRKMCSNYQDLNFLNQEELFRIIAIKQQKCKETTLNYLLKTLEQYYYYLLKIGTIEVHPLKDFRVKMPKKPILKDFLSEEELTSIYEKMPSKGHYSGQFDCFALRKKVIVGLLVYQGLSSGDLGKIELQDIDLEKGTIAISKDKNYKLNARKLVLSPNQVLELHQYIMKIRGKISQFLKQKDSQKLFPFSEKSDMKSLTKGIKKVIQKHSQIKDLQQIRYSRIALWLKVFNPREVQYKAGYKSLISLEKFQQDRLESLKQAVEKHHIF